MSTNDDMDRRAFLKEIVVGTVSLSAMAATTRFAMATPAVPRLPSSVAVARYPIDPDVRTTIQRTIAFPSVKGLLPPELPRIEEYRRYGYGVWHYGPGLGFDMVSPYTSALVWAVGDLFSPHGGTLNLMKPVNYMGTLDGSTPDGRIVGAGPVSSFGAAPTVTADPNRRPLTSHQWISEFLKTSSAPVGHGFNLVDPHQGDGFACYSFVPRADVPLKVIVLDDNQALADGSYDIHGHGFLDEQRWTWLRKELADGDAADQLMIVAAHIPIGVAPLGSQVEWWRPDLDPYAGAPVPGHGKPRIQNAVTLRGLVTELQSHPNFLMWIAGHRHVNVIKAFPGPTPEQGFWQVETSSLRDFPQQFRTFDLYVNSDDSVSVVAVNVDPSVAKGSPAARSRDHAVACQQILESPHILQRASELVDIDTQKLATGADGRVLPDTSIRPMPTGSYNAELLKRVSPRMAARLRGVAPR